MKGYGTGTWSLVQQDEAAHVFMDGRPERFQGVPTPEIAAEFDEWCDLDRVPPGERNGVWEALRAYLELDPRP